MRASHRGGLVEPLETRRLLSLSLLADFNTTTASSGASPPVSLGSVGLFSANDVTHGYELWRTDGTVGGTSMLKDINPGSGGSIDSQLFRAGNYVFFTASDGGTDQLWRSDGTAAGTIKLTSVQNGFSIYYLTDFNGVAIFGNSTQGLWRSDGTVAGTVQIAPLGASQFAQLGDRIYFLASPISGGNIGLWQTDATSGGTVLVRQFADTYAPTLIYSFSGRLYFWASDSTLADGDEPWSSDGTTSGTVPLGDLVAGSNSSYLQDIGELNGAVYFKVATASEDAESLLYRTDGSAAGTVEVADLGSFGASEFPAGMIAFNNELYFEGHAENLWRTDGTAAGTSFFYGTEPTREEYGFQIFNGKLYFIGYDARGEDLFSTDGTTAGTQSVAHFPTIDYGGSPTIFNNRLWLDANDGLHGGELWSTDGTSAGTTMLEDFDTNTNDFNPSSFTLGPGGFYYFTANDGVDGTQLWKTDGTAAGTSMVTNSGQVTISTTTPFQFVNGLLLFAGQDADGLELWRSDGTTAGTFRVVDIAPGQTSGLRSGLLIPVGNQVFFAATSDTGFNQNFGLWVSDGTASGTRLVRPGGAGLSTTSFGGIAYNGKLIFSARNLNSTDGTGVFISDGTLAGTTQLNGSFNDNIVMGYPTLFNGKVYFADGGLNPVTGFELWSTDGTAAGTAMVADINPGQSGSSPSDLVATPDALYFAAINASVGPQLWRIDRVTSKLTKVTTNSAVQQVAASASGGVIFSTSSDQVYHFDGTNLILLTSRFTAVPKLLGSANGLDYFSANTSAAGTELWMTDGTAAGTVMLQDLVPGSGSSSPQNLSVINGTVYVSATTPATGREIYVLPPFARLNSDGSLTLEGTQASDVLSLNASGGTVSASLFGATLSIAQSSITSGVHVIGDGGTSDTLNVNGGTFSFDDDLGITASNPSVSIAPGADVTFASTQHLNSLSISGTARLAAGGANVLVTKSLTLQPGGIFDLADNPAIIDYTTSSPLATVQSKIAEGYAGGSWAGPGIRSSIATASGTALAFAESSKILGPTGGTFAGQMVDGSAVLIRYALAADANLDGQVNSLDFDALAANFGKTSGVSFNQGDFNYDGIVNALDFNALATLYGSQFAPPTPASPASLAAPRPSLFGDKTLTDANALLDDSPASLIA